MKNNTTYIMPKEQVELMLRCFNCGFCDFTCARCKYHWRITRNAKEAEEILNENRIMV